MIATRQGISDGLRYGGSAKERLTCSRFRHRDTIPGLVEPDVRHRSKRRIFLIFWRVGLPKNADSVPRPEGPAADATEGIEAERVCFREELANVDHEWTLRVAIPHVLDQVRVLGALIRRFDLQQSSGNPVSIRSGLWRPAQQLHTFSATR